MDHTRGRGAGPRFAAPARAATAACPALTGLADTSASDSRTPSPDAFATGADITVHE